MILRGKRPDMIRALLASFALLLMTGLSATAQEDPVRACMKDVATALTVTKLAAQPSLKNTDIMTRETALRDGLLKLTSTYLTNRSTVVGPDAATAELSRMIEDVFTEIRTDTEALTSIRADLKDGNADMSSDAIGEALGCTAAF